MTNKTYFQSLYNRVLNGKRTISQALKYMTDNYNGSNRKSIRHQMDATPIQTEAELRLSMLLRDAMRLGRGNDYNFDIVFR